MTFRAGLGSLLSMWEHGAEGGNFRNFGFLLNPRLGLRLFCVVNPVFSFTHDVGCSPRLSYLGVLGIESLQAARN